MKTKKIIAGISLALLGHFAQAQNGLNGIVVEKYYVSVKADTTKEWLYGALPIGSVTYRIYADMQPGYKFEALYGTQDVSNNPLHTLKINTSTKFFNAKDRGASTAEAISSAYLNQNSNALDSWFSVGAAATGKAGVLKSEDIGGTNLLFPHTATATMLSSTVAAVGIPLTVQDGIIAGSPKSVVFVGDAAAQATSVFGNVSQAGSSFSTQNGSIASLDGSVGLGTSNKVLIGQFTTDGVFHFELNVQIGTPSGHSQNYVAKNPTGSEISIPSLIGTFPMSIATSSVSATHCAGSAISVHYTAVGTFGAGNVFTAQLSNSAGTFSNTSPVIIGTATTTTSGTINATIPSNTKLGTAYKIRVVSSNPAITGTDNGSPITINILPAEPGVIAGPAMVCPNASYSYSVTPVTGATYVWTLPAGVSGSSTTNTITVTLGNLFTAGTLSVTANSPCSTSAVRTLAIKSAPAEPGVITGPTVGVCPSATYSVAPITGATDYTWTLPAGATGNSTTNSITVTFSGFTTGTLSVTANSVCGSSVARTLALTSVPKEPGVIAGPTVGLCTTGTSSTTYSITPVAGATEYSWTLPTGATGSSSTNSIAVSFDGSFVSGNISVIADNTCGSSIAKTLALKSVPATPATIIEGSHTACANATGVMYSVTPIAGATGYVWTVPTGASIVSGAGTSTITVNYGTKTGNVKVTATNACGLGMARSLPITFTCKSLVDGSSSITDEVTESSLTIYPNPFTSQTTISFPEVQNNTTIKIIDVLGKEMKTINFTGTDCVIEKGTMSEGIYNVQITDANGNVVNKKIIVQ